MNRELRVLFHELAPLSRDRREQILAERGIAPGLRLELESLLRFDDQPADLTGLIAGAAGDLLRTPPPDLDRCGPYRLARLLGTGGMGSVYLAERADGELQQLVAIKLLRAGGDLHGWRDRFLNERQLLSLLRHPAIVHMIDAGHTLKGRPYLVMEYVEGVSLDVHAASCSASARLRIFLQVCEGVAYAHRHLVIHRDLKPANILVDPRGQPKILDFGIAKIVGQAGGADTVAPMMTPNYASPEQLAGLTQTTATDIYSLAAILYKMFTGVSPRESGAASRSGEIPAPGTFRRDSPRDLDYIVAKGLRPEPEERYHSVDELAADVQALLDRRPVAARSASHWYCARRFLRRRWMPLTGALLVLASLSAGLYIADRQRLIAERRFADVRDLANRYLDVDVQVAQLQGGSKARQLIVDTALEYLRRVSADAQRDPKLTLELATAYMRVARVQGVNISPNLGQTEQADRSAQRAASLIDSLLLRQPRDRITLLRAAQIAHDRMILASDRRRDEEAFRFAQLAMQRLDAYLATGPLTAASDRLEAQQAIIVLINVANRFNEADRFEEGIRISRRAIETARATGWTTQVGSALTIIALANRARGELDQALTAIRESVRILQPAPEETSAGRLAAYALSLSREGQILGENDAVSLERFPEARDRFERALEINRRFARGDSTDFRSQYAVFAAEMRLAGILRHAQPERALELYDDGLERLAHVRENGGTTRNEAAALIASAGVLRQLGRLTEARKRLDDAFARLERLHLYPASRITLGSETDRALRARAQWYADAGDRRRAVAVCQELLDGIDAVSSKVDVRVDRAFEQSTLLQTVAAIFTRAGRTDAAAAARLRRLELWNRWNRKLPDNPFVRRQLELARLP